MNHDLFSFTLSLCKSQIILNMKNKYFNLEKKTQEIAFFLQENAESSHIGSVFANKMVLD